jgi:hypothetical protein
MAAHQCAPTVLLVVISKWFWTQTMGLCCVSPLNPPGSAPVNTLLSPRHLEGTGSIPVWDAGALFATCHSCQASRGNWATQCVWSVLRDRLFWQWQCRAINLSVCPTWSLGDSWGGEWVLICVNTVSTATTTLCVCNHPPLISDTWASSGRGEIF